MPSQDLFSGATAPFGADDNAGARAGAPAGSLFASPLLDHLNPEQLAAVTLPAGHALILAGAGSGKTRVLTTRIAWLLQTGQASPGGILAVTFTNKAAKEMVARLSAMLPINVRGMWIGTFHGLCNRMLRAHHQLAGLPATFQILDTQDQLSAIKRLCKQHNVDEERFPPKQLVWFIAGCKEEGMRPKDVPVRDQETERKVELYQLYEQQCQREGVVDFGELMLRSYELLRDNDPVRAHYQRRFSHILVDEFQDTNRLQYAWLKQLAGDVVDGQLDARGSVIAVGDDDQSIYGWRGATLDNLKKLPVDFPHLRVIKLEQNYRSTSAILRAANHVIGPNPKLFPKTLFSELGEGEPVRVQDCDNEEHEAERAVARILSLRAAANPPPSWKSFAILYRANHQAKPFEKALRKANIPYKVSGGTSFFDRAEIRDLCAWFRLWINNDDDPAFLRAVANPKRGIGHTTLGALGAFAAQHRTSMFGALFNAMLPAAVPKRALDGLTEFGRAINDLEYRARHTHGAQDARAFLADWLKDIGYEQHLYDAEDSEKVAAARWNNVLEFCDWMAQRAGGQIEDAAGTTTQKETKSLLEVAQTIALLSTISEREQEQDMVVLSTLHASKGLEWPHVILAGVTEGMLPFKLDDDEGRQQKVTEDIASRLQEERRLMYVGITRAQRTLAVSWTRKRKRGREMVACQPSRFIAEMKLDAATAREDPREKLRQLRAEFAARADAAKV
ncbi:MAG TPA: ATP-dependent DNA helicase Rep [Comamonadaceae bacterium]|nr:ATP-dependent DNA helicase Rep [Comamonadaceae bacterium]